MAIFLARHGERLDCAECFNGNAEECYWDETTEFPWDPPLTASGECQAKALGREASQLAEQLGFPPISHVFSSPFVRCFETGANVAKAVDLESVCVEPSLAEGFDEPFYRSWCVPGADCTYGGPAHCRMGVPVASHDLHSAARLPAHTLIPKKRTEQLDDVPAAMDKSYEPLMPYSAFQYLWGKFETEEQLQSRLVRFFEFVVRTFPDESVMLVSHGGPLRMLFRAIFPDAPNVMCGYCGLYVLHKADGGWVSPLYPGMPHPDDENSDKHTCMNCGVLSKDGARGTGVHSDQWYCDRCWQTWEG